MEEETNKQQASGYNGHLAAFCSLAATWLTVVDGTVFAILPPQHHGKADVEHEGAQKAYFSDFDDGIGAHEVAKGTIGIASVIGKDE